MYILNILDKGTRSILQKNIEKEKLTLSQGWARASSIVILCLQKNTIF